MKYFDDSIRGENRGDEEKEPMNFFMYQDELD